MQPAFIVIAIIAAVIIAAVIISAVSKAKNNRSDTEPEPEIPEEDEIPEIDTSPVTFSEDLTVSFDGITLDYADELENFATQAAITSALKPETPSLGAVTPKKSSVKPDKYLEETTVKTDNPAEASDEAIKTIGAFFSGKYYFDGSMINEMDKLPLEIAMAGENYHVFSEMDGKDIAIMRLDGKIYLMNPDTMKYTEINSAVKRMMGVSEDTFNFSFNSIKFDPKSPASVTEAKYNGSPAECYTYFNDEHRIEFIAEGGEIRQMALFNSSGDADTVLQADEFSADIPSEMLSFQGYSKTNIVSFISSMM